MPRTRTVIYEITASIKKTNTQTADAFNGTDTHTHTYTERISARVDDDFIVKFI